MAIDNKILSDSILHLTDSLIKLSSALLVVPIVFLRFVAELGPKAHPEAILGVYPVSGWLKVGILAPFGFSILASLVAKYIVVHKLSHDAVLHNGKLCRPMMVAAWLSGICFVTGVGFLIYLFLQFPIEIPEPFKLDRTRLR